MKIKQILQKIRLALGKMLLDRQTQNVNGQIIPKKILFLRKDGKIGDFVVSSFVYREIKRFNPHIEIGVVCTPKNQMLFMDNPYIDNIHLLPSRGFKDHWLLSRELMNFHYDTVIDPTVLLRNRDLFLLRCINAKYYIGYKKENYQLFNLNITDNLHFSEIYHKALNLCGINNVNVTYELPFNPERAEKIQRYILEKKLDNYIAINFFGAANSRKFLLENIRRFITQFRVKQPQKQLVLLTYPEITPILKPLLSDSYGIFMYEDTQTIFDTVELIKYADWVISPDTAIVHIASGLNKKLVAFYQKNDENWYNWQPTTQAECHVLFFEKNINEIQANQLDFEWFN
ncbi:glycosyltransferase family 9 protein [Bibersteinia trehalosi]|uniref:glycosyltransferase family 9 protein n=1 Tax=Bibersteinia trehalosi TaxID=47735 RepID=UPI003D2C0684